MPDSLAKLLEGIAQNSDAATIHFYTNGLEGQAYFELNQLLERVAQLFETLSRSGGHSEILSGLSALFPILNSSIEQDDVVKICDLLNFELRPLLLALEESP